ncbi:unnamed protein product [Cunninghamella blakesleeana]
MFTNDIIVDVSSLHVKLIPSSLELTIEDKEEAISPYNNNNKKDILLWQLKVNVQTDKQTHQLNNSLSQEKQWWSSKTILEKNIQSLNCRHCKQPLINLKTKDGIPFKCKDLPSEHWYELVECWICHEAKPEEHRARMRPIFAKQSVLLVGTYYFLIHINDFLSNDTLKLDNEVANQVNWDRGTTTKWIPINCGKCGKVLGEGHYERQNDKDLNLMEVKIFKYCIKLQPTIDETPNFINFVAGDMINAAKVHATRKYLIQGRKSNRIYALIWLFNWDTTIIYNNGFIDDEEEDNNSDRIEKKNFTWHNENVMKLFYVDTRNNAETVKKWTLDKATDHLIYPDPYCEQLVKYLQKSTSILPSNLRIMNHPAMIMMKNFSVGFLPQ